MNLEKSKEKVSIGYFTNNYNVTSETFISDLIHRLSEIKNIDLTVYTANRQDEFSDNRNFKLVSIGFKQRGKIKSKYLYFLGRLLSKGSYYVTAVLIYKYFINNNIPYIVHVHGYDVTSEFSDLSYVNEFRKMCANATVIISPSQHLRRRMILEGCPPDKIVVEHYSIDFKRIMPRDWTHLKSEKPSLVFLGRLIPKKNPIALLYAFKLVLEKHPETTLTIIGTGSLQEQVRETIESLGLSGKVFLKGALPQLDCFKILRNCWIYVQHSVTASGGDQEGFPVSLAEASAHGLPVISTIHSGIPENIINQETGYVVQEHNFEEMAEKIIYLLDHPELIPIMGNKGRKRIKQICNQDNRTSLITDLLMSN